MGNIGELLLDLRKDDLKQGQLTQEEKEIIILRSKQGVSIKEISAEIGRHYTTIKHFEDKMGLPSNPKTYGIAKEDREPIYDLYNSGLTLQQIHDTYYPQYTTDQINHICRTKGITRRNGKQVHLNESYFETIDSNRKAYWLGMLLADGCVQYNPQKGNSYTISLELMTQDKYIIEEFAKDTGTDLKVKSYVRTTGFQRKDGTPHSTAKISLSSVKMANDLIRYGVVPNKSYKQKNLPNFDEKYIRSFMLGYFDGNGSVTSNKDLTNPRVLFYGDHLLTSEIMNYFAKGFPTKPRAIIDQKNALVSFTTFGGIRDVLAFYHYLYDEADIYIKRKKEKFEELIRQYRDKHVA